MNINFTVYCKTTGRVLRCGFCHSPEAAQRQAQQGEDVLLDVYESDGFVIDGCHSPLPPRPSPDHVFDYTIKAWVYDADKAVQNVREARRRAYPPVEDYLDAVVKGDQAQIKAYIARCREVKTQYPKPKE